MTVETFTPHAEVALPAVIGGDLPGLAVLAQWADANDAATRLVARWVFTDLVPVHHWPLPPGRTLRDFPNPRMKHPQESEEDYRHRCEVTTASAAGTVLRGIGIGLPPNIALEQMHSIRGTIGMKTKGKLALVKSRGRKAWDVSLSEDQVTCAGIDPTTGETVEITITMRQAEKAGWTTNEAYRKTPIDMLWSRAMSRVLDRIAGDVLFGLPSVEDIDDAPQVHAEVVEPARPASARAAAVLAAAQPVPAPAVEAPAPVTAAPVEAPAPEQPAAPEPGVQPSVAEQQDPDAAISEGQWRAINARLLELGVKGDGQKAARARVIRTILDAPDLNIPAMTYGQAAFVLDQLAGENGQRIVADVLNPPAPAEESSDVNEQDHERARGEHDADPYADYDSSLELDGAEAAAEGM